jgi:hypothetical protein
MIEYQEKHVEITNSLSYLLKFWKKIKKYNFETQNFNGFTSKLTELWQTRVTRPS